MEEYRHYGTYRHKTGEYLKIEVSNYGNVKVNGELVNEFKVNSSGYKYFYKIGFIHRAVATLFIPNPENKNEVDHIDTNRHNNRADNLQWCTRKENLNNPLTRIHMREAQKNSDYVISEETRRKLSEAGKGRTYQHTEKTKEKMRNAWKIRIAEGYVQPSTGKPVSDETKRKISESLKGRHLPKEHRDKLSKCAANKIWINNGKITKRVFPDDVSKYPDFVLGRLRLKKKI